MNTEGVNTIKMEGAMNTKAAQRYSGTNSKDKDAGEDSISKSFEYENGRVS